MEDYLAEDRHFPVPDQVHRNPDRALMWLQLNALHPMGAALVLSLWVILLLTSRSQNLKSSLKNLNPSTQAREMLLP